MTDFVSKARIVEMMTAERRQWEAVLAKIDEECMTLPAINHGWSIKDTIAHVTYYERWLLEWLEAAVRGQVTLATHRDSLSVDDRNAIVFEENRSRPLHQVLDESRQVFDRLLLLVKLMPEADLTDPHRFERYTEPFWHDSRNLAKCIAVDSYDHYREHRLSIRAWLRRHPAEEREYAVGRLSELRA